MCLVRFRGDVNTLVRLLLVLYFSQLCASLRALDIKVLWVLPMSLYGLPCALLCELWIKK